MTNKAPCPNRRCVPYPEVECPAGLSTLCTVNPYDCPNYEYCENITCPLPLPYEYCDECLCLTVKPLCYYGEETQRDLSAEGWNEAMQMPYEYRDGCLTVWGGFFGPDGTTEYGFEAAQRLPYEYRDGALIVTNCSSDGWWVAEFIRWNFWVEKDGCQVYQVANGWASREGFALSEALPYRVSKRGLTVLRAEGEFVPAKPIEQKRYEGLPLYTYVDILPSHLKFLYQLKEMRLQPAPEQQPVAYYHKIRPASKIPLWDVREAVAIATKEPV
ncbi:MAG TPA: hypothetical protein V6D06_14555 [Trichocoleus sp.]